MFTAAPCLACLVMTAKLWLGQAVAVGSWKGPADLRSIKPFASSCVYLLKIFFFFLSVN